MTVDCQPSCWISCLRLLPSIRTEWLRSYLFQQMVFTSYLAHLINTQSWLKRTQGLLEPSKVHIYWNRLTSQWLQLVRLRLRRGNWLELQAFCGACPWTEPHFANASPFFLTISVKNKTTENLTELRDPVLNSDETLNIRTEWRKFSPARQCTPSQLSAQRWTALKVSRSACKW